MAKKSSGPGKKAQYKRYKDQAIYKRNRLRKLKRHVKKFPLDLIAMDALKRAEQGQLSYRRS